MFLTLFLSCPHSLLEQGRSQSVSWDGFPHHLGDGARAQLYNTAFLHLQVGLLFYLMLDLFAGMRTVVSSEMVRPKCFRFTTIMQLLTPAIVMQCAASRLCAAAEGPAEPVQPHLDARSSGLGAVPGGSSQV